MFQVLGFLYLFLDDGSIIVQNKHGVFKVTDEEMIVFIQEIDQANKYYYISKEFINTFFPDHSDEAISFLERLRILKEIHSMNYDFNSLKVYSNDDNIIKYFSIYENTETSDDFFVKVISKKNVMNDLKNTDFLLVILDPYDKNLAKEIKKAADNADAGLLLAFYFDFGFVVSNAYRKSWSVPCFKCTESLVMNGMRTSAGQETSYQNIISHLYEESVNFKIGAPLSMFDASFVGQSLLEITDHLISKSYNEKIGVSVNDDFSILDIYFLDLEKHKFMKDTAIFDEACDCYE